MKTIFIILIFLLIFVFTAVSHTRGVETKGTFTPIVLTLTVDNPYPFNNSVDIDLNVTLNITCTSQQGYTMNISWYENTSGSWLLVQQNLSITNGTYNCTYINASNYFTKYWWKIAATDGMGNTNNKTFCFTTRSNASIIITDVYPADGSSNIPTEPVCSAMVNHINGSVMNISWYFGVSSGNENILLGSNNSVNNGTYSISCYLAGAGSTTYFWKICVNDGDVWQNESYSFTTGISSDAIVMSSGDRDMAMVTVFLFVGLMVGMIIPINILRNKKRQKDEVES